MVNTPPRGDPAPRALGSRPLVVATPWVPLVAWTGATLPIALGARACPVAGPGAYKTGAAGTPVVGAPEPPGRGVVAPREAARVVPALSLPFGGAGLAPGAR